MGKVLLVTQLRFACVLWSVLASAVSSSQSATIGCPLESVAMVATPATISSSSGGRVSRHVSFARGPEVFEHEAHHKSLMFPVAEQ